MSIKNALSTIADALQIISFYVEYKEPVAKTAKILCNQVLESIEHRIDAIFGTAQLAVGVLEYMTSFPIIGNLLEAINSHLYFVMLHSEMAKAISQIVLK